MNFFSKDIEQAIKKGKLPLYMGQIFNKFYSSYLAAAIENGYAQEQVETLLMQLLQLSIKQISYPYRFEAFHKRILTPFNYYQFGINFIRPLIDLKNSSVYGKENLLQITKQLQANENVILFANHQIEPDPQVISILLEDSFPFLSEEMIFIAGHRVVTDPLAVPFSLGRNLLCIFSKNYIEHPFEQKAEKLVHNQRTLKKMGKLLAEGGKCIYVAPSGGRDRPNLQGIIQPNAFDPQSIELFLLLAKQIKKLTHFYLLTLATYPILPPPNVIKKELGEKREAKAAPAFLHFEQELDLETPFIQYKNKIEKKKKRALFLTEKIRTTYQHLVTNV